MKKVIIDRHFIELDHRRVSLVYLMLLLSEIYLFLDNVRRGTVKTGLVALACAIVPFITLFILYVIRPGEKFRRFTLNISVFFSGLTYLLVFGWFMLSGGTGGTSIFLVFMAGPVAFFFFNMFCGSVFCLLLFIEIIIYMETPLRSMGYSYPEMYYQRLPIILFLEIIICALAQYDLVRARIRHDKALEEVRVANEAKSDFLANTSHEMRTPLNAVLGFGELILRDKDISASTRDYCRQIMSAGQNLLYIINDILDFSRIEAGKFKIVKDEFLLSELVNDISNIANTRKKDDKTTIFINADCSMPDKLCGDIVRIRQIISNLLINAIKYTPEGAIVVDIGLEKGDGVFLTCSVKDTGIGIKKEDLERIFQSFQQVDMKRNRSIEGTGLGLAISERLAKIMGGDISVESEYGSGSVFTVRIPVDILDQKPFADIALFRKYDIGVCVDTDDFGPKAQDEVASNIAFLCRQIGMHRMVTMGDKESIPIQWETLTHCLTDDRTYMRNKDFFDRIKAKTKILFICDRLNDDIPESFIKVERPFSSYLIAAALSGIDDRDVDIPDDKESFKLEGARVLIVDDNQTNIIVIGKLLEGYGIKADSASDGYEALSVMGDVPYDLIFMDHMMPRMDGIETVKRFKESDPKQNISTPIVALTANAILGMREMFLENGFNDYLSKPVEIGELERVLKAYLADEMTEGTVKASGPDKVFLPESIALVLKRSELIDLEEGRKNRLDKENLSIYAGEYERTRRELTDAYSGRDMKSYNVRVHALKSSSRMVGATGLGSLAEQAEKASSGSGASFDELHEELIRTYDAVIAVIKEALA